MAAFLVVAACTNPDDPEEEASPNTTRRVTTTNPARTTIAITIAGNPRTTTTIPTELQGGGASIGGSVVGPEGAVSGAVVRVERFVGSTSVSTDVAVPSGSWQLSGVYGGRYRVRAWRVPDLAQVEPTIFFLGADETRTIDLRLTRYGALTASATVEPNPPPIGQPAVLAVQLFGGAVDSQGIVQGSAPSAAQVQLILTGVMVLESPDRVVTDNLGVAKFNVRCRDAGQPTGVVVIGASQLTVPLPPCGRP